MIAEFHRRIPPQFKLVEGNRTGVVFRPETVHPDVLDTVRRLEARLSGRPTRPFPPNIIGRVMPGKADNFPRNLGKPGRQTVFLLDGNSLRTLPGTREEIRAYAGYLPEEVDDGPLAFYIAPDTGIPIATWDVVLALARTTDLIHDLDPTTDRAVRSGSYSTIISHGTGERYIRHRLHTGMGANALYIGNGTVFNFDTRRTVSSELIGGNAPTLNPMGAVIFVGE